MSVVNTQNGISPQPEVLFDFRLKPPGADCHAHAAISTLAVLAVSNDPAFGQKVTIRYLVFINFFTPDCL
jgi:hypothetical protein